MTGYKASRKIATKVIIGIAVTVLSINTENQQIEERMNLQLSQIITEVEQSLDNHSKVVSSLSTTIGITGTQLTVPEYNALLTQYVGLNADTYGAGVWFDYNGYQPGIKYFGPYALPEFCGATNTKGHWDLIQNKLLHIDSFNSEQTPEIDMLVNGCFCAWEKHT